MREDTAMIRQQICAEFLSASKAKKVISLMPIIIPGGTYDSDNETRLRTRFAVLAALAQKKYEQDQWNKIQYFKLDGRRVRGPDSAAGGPESSPCKTAEPGLATLLVPYEWFSAGADNRSNCSKVLVLWLEDSQFDEKPLSRMLNVVNGIAPVGGLTQASYPLRLIGPTWSSTLREMFVELADSRFQTSPAWRLAVYSPWATANSEYLLKTAGVQDRICMEETESSSRIWSRTAATPCPKAPADGKTVIERTIAEDGRLVQELVFELKARGVDVCSEGSVMLISEWDSLYGQLFEQTFRDQLKANNEKLCEGKKTPTKLSRLIYLMGLDGKLPGDPATAAPVAAEGRKTGETSAEDIERPDGRSQIDYLRRMSDKLARSASPQVKAIGVLGSDVFDKLLVLEALRDRLPHVTFFTTDLDAHYLHPSQRRWTRNLVVASSFGLDYPAKRLDEEPQPAPPKEELPPLRDTYQTAMYAACSRALEFDAQEEASERELLKQQKAPKLFEVGRTELFELASAKTDDRWPGFGGISVALTSVLLGTGFIVCYGRIVFYGRRGSVSPSPWLRRRWFAVAAVAAALFIAEISCYALQIVREPFAWFQGVSVWPSAILRTLAAVLAAYSLGWLPDRIERSDIDFSRIFVLPYHHGGGTKLSDARWGYWLPLVRVGSAQRSEPVKVSTLWEAYQRSGALAERLKRVLVFSALYIAASGLLFLFLGPPNAPYRGRGSLVAVNFPLGVGVILQVVLTFFVVDATCLCRSMVRQMTVAGKIWPGTAAGRWKIDEKTADEALTVDFIARRTKVVGQMILLPFAVLVLIILSRNLYFARWDWPPQLLVIYTVNSLIAICCSVVLWSSGGKARRWAVSGIQEKLLQAGNGEEGHARQLNLMLEIVRATQEGAFAPLGAQPVFAALFLPFGGVGMASLLDLLANRL